jgi:23S rRNA (adenine1618-N6)-methyltransferase
LEEKSRLHPRNRNRERYDLHALITSIPALKDHVISNKYGVETIDFSKPISVKLLNQAILKHYYGLKNWDFPNENLCPPIPGRADYIHYMADLLAETNLANIPRGNKITCLDIGIGASAIYPIIGVLEYDWYFIGSDISSKSISSVENMINLNPKLEDKIECRLQKEHKSIFRGIIKENEKIDLTICNPPFHTSQAERKEKSKTFQEKQKK